MMSIAEESSSPLTRSLFPNNIFSRIRIPHPVVRVFPGLREKVTVGTIAANIYVSDCDGTSYSPVIEVNTMTAAMAVSQTGNLLKACAYTATQCGAIQFDEQR